MWVQGASGPRGLWSGGLQHDGDPAEEIGFGACGCEGQTDARGGLDDAGAELEESEPQGGEFGVAEVMGCGNRVTDVEHQPIGGGMENQTDLVGDRRSAAGSIGGELSLVHLDQVLGLAAGAVDHVIDPLGRSDGEVVDDKADVEAEGGRLDAGASATRGVPGFCLVSGLGEAAQHRFAAEGAVAGPPGSPAVCASPNEWNCYSPIIAYDQRAQFVVRRRVR